ncbi:hypothetical protein CI109_107117 [Kwoniella shandongensis]|uniref:Uncharacterized protein n=1 Tax=Kwoniella shandongensis TaxID=1734106 RepID=A0A5M6C782_9TREE|nr:uncharacterized protein CI109_002400 [Kwoniella shandongensis]KAA5529059.1 hypothetical protein CI109_002400 [Kwoniella shandongensis]
MTPIDSAYADQLESIGHEMFTPNQGLAFGPYILGFGVDAFTYGLLVIQFLHWFQVSSATDRRAIKALVWYILLTSTAYSILSTVYMFELFVYGYSVYRNFYDFNWITTFFIGVCLMQTPVSGFFAFRAYYLLGKSRLFAIITSTLLTISFATCIAVKVVAPKVTVSVGADSYPATFILLVVWLATIMITDVIVTLSITYALLRTRLGFRGFERTDNLIRKIVMISIEAQLIPTVFTAGFLITFAAAPNGNLPAFFICTPKIYALALMSVLNARQFLQKDLGPRPHPQRPMYIPRISSYKSNNPQNQAAQNAAGVGAGQTQTEIHVQTETIQETYQLKSEPAKRSINRDPPLMTPPTAGLDNPHFEFSSDTDTATDQVDHDQSITYVDGEDDVHAHMKEMASLPKIGEMRELGVEVK